MAQHSKGRVIAGAVMITAVLWGMSYGYTAPGSQAAEQTETGNYPLGCPMGGIGGGNFNFLLDGNYNTTYIRVAAPSGAPPTILCFVKRGATTFWATDMQHGSSGNGTMTTTFIGYWPTVTMHYAQSGMLDTIVLKAFSPICAGDNKNSSLPLCIYKFTITNTGSAVDTAAVALQNSANSTIISSGGRILGITGNSICVMVDTAKVYAADSVTCSSANTGFTTTGLLNKSGAGYLAKRVIVPAGGTRTVTFSVAWTSVSNGFYRNYFTDVQLLGAYGRDSAVALEAKVDNWHNKILNSNLPDWLKDLVINSCHTYNSMTDWTNSGTYGTYGMAESMSSGNYGCIDQSYHGSMALPIFAPTAAWSEVQRIAGAQFTSGTYNNLIAHFYPSDAEPRADGGAKLILQALRNYLWTGNTSALNSLWNNYVNAITGIRSLDTDGDGLTEDNYLNTYDNPMWDGWVIVKKEYDNELDLAAMRAMQKIAVVHGSTTDSVTYRGYYNTTSTGFERANSSGFWNTTLASRSGYTGYYSGSTNISGTGQAVWPCLLEGQWYADLCGLGPIHPEARIQTSCRIVQDVCCDQTTVPSYYYMIAYPPNGATHYVSGSPGYVCYGEYPAGGMCVAFQHNLPDISMRALHYYWNITFSKYHRVYNVPCKVTAAGAGTDWGINRYMFPPGVFASLFGITGFAPDIAGRSLRIKPSLPTSTQYRLAGDSLAAAPLMNPVSLGTVDYRNNSTSSYQRFVVRFDNPIQFDKFYTKKLYAQTVSVIKPAVGGSSVAATIAVNSADTSEYAVTFGSTLTFDSSGVLITIPGQSGTHDDGAAKMTTVELTVDQHRGTISYVLPQRMQVNLSVVNARGVTVMRFESEESAGRHAVLHDWAHTAPGVYYAYLRAGDRYCIKKLVHVR
jgi:uncharacterized protein (DUF608 family)